MSKIILIDDDQFFHRIARLMMKAYGPVEQVISSEDGKKTIDFLLANKSNAEALPDYIFVDLNMPVFSGWDFLNNYNKIYKTLGKDIKVYIVSSSIDPDDIRRAKHYPFVKLFVNKPLTKELIRQVADDPGRSHVDAYFH